MRHLALAGWVALASAVSAEEGAWTRLDGEAIRSALSGRTLQYPTARQVFHASGRTLYDAGQPSWGYWRIEDDAYCSQWPPSDLWSCYGLERRGATLRFVGAAGDTTEGVYAD